MKESVPDPNKRQSAAPPSARARKHHESISTNRARQPSSDGSVQSDRGPSSGNRMTDDSRNSIPSTASEGRVSRPAGAGRRRSGSRSSGDAKGGTHRISAAASPARRDFQPTSSGAAVASESLRTANPFEMLPCDDDQSVSSRATQSDNASSQNRSGFLLNKNKPHSDRSIHVGKENKVDKETKDKSAAKSRAADSETKKRESNRISRQRIEEKRLAIAKSLMSAQSKPDPVKQGKKTVERRGKDNPTTQKLKERQGSLSRWIPQRKAQHLRAFDEIYGGEAPARNGQSTGVEAAEKVAEQALEEYYTDAFAQDKKRELLRQAFTLHKFHLPGNNWCQDWIAYFRNNHPVLGICSHHPDHPIGKVRRVLILLGSMGFGLVVANFVYLAFICMSDEGIDHAIHVANFTFTEDGPKLMQEVQKQNRSANTYELILLFVGAPIHAFFDNIVWGMELDPCLQKGGCCEALPWIGKICTILTIVWVIASISMIFVMQEISQNVDISSISDAHGLMTGSHLKTLESLDQHKFAFLVWWYAELAIEYFVFHFLVGTLIFSGCLNCVGCMPFFAGRPKEMLALNGQSGTAEEADLLQEHLAYRKREAMAKKRAPV